MALPFFGLMSGSTYFTTTADSVHYWNHAIMNMLGYPAMFLLWLSGGGPAPSL